MSSVFYNSSFGLAHLFIFCISYLTCLNFFTACVLCIDMINAPLLSHSAVFFGSASSFPHLPAVTLTDCNVLQGPLKLSKSAKKRVNQKRRQEAAKSQELGQSAQVQQEADSVFNKPAEQHPCPDLTTVPVSSEGASFLLEEAPQTSSASDQAPLETSTSDNHPNPVETTIVEALQAQSTQEAMEADSGKKVEVVKTKEEILRERQEKKAAKNAKKANSAPAKKENQPVETPKEGNSLSNQNTLCLVLNTPPSSRRQGR